MHPYMSQSLATERIRGWLDQAAEDSRARQARCNRRTQQTGRVSRAGARLMRVIGHPAASA
jgi:hypothetical protein